MTVTWGVLWIFGIAFSNCCVWFGTRWRQSTTRSSRATAWRPSSGWTFKNLCSSSSKRSVSGRTSFCHLRFKASSSGACRSKSYEQMRCSDVESETCKFAGRLKSRTWCGPETLLLSAAA